MLPAFGTEQTTSSLTVGKKLELAQQISLVVLMVESTRPHLGPRSRRRAAVPPLKLIAKLAQGVPS